MRYKVLAVIFSLIIIGIYLRISLISFEVGIVYLFILLVSCFFWWSEFLLTWYLVDDAGIKNYGIRRRHSFVRWEDVDNIEANSTFDVYRLVADGGRTVLKIKRRMTGMSQFEALVKKHLPGEKWKRAFVG